MGAKGRWRVLAAVAAVPLVAACLGQDHRDVELALSDWDHGWLAVVEQEESFTVGLPENPQFPDAQWTLIADGSPTLEVLGSTLERPQGVPAEEPQLTWWVFDVVGREAGEAQLAFELDADGRTMDRFEVRVAVEADACASEAGISAPRCGGPQQVTVPRGESDQWVSEREHGSTVTLSPTEQLSVVLTGNAAQPGAAWRFADADPAVVEVSDPREQESRTPGNWDTADTSEPGSFLPRSEFVVTAVAPGRTTLRFELADGDGVIEFAEFTVAVGSG